MPKRREPDLATSLLAARAASLSYEQGRSNIEIAEELEVSRFRVARLLELAREAGIVRFNVTLPDAMQPELSERLRRRYWLDHCVVVESTPSAESSRDRMGRAAARLLRDLLSEDDVLGIAWGRTLSAMVQHVRDLPPCPVVQLTGIAGDPAQNSLELVRMVSQRSGGTAYPLFAPMVLPDTATLAGLRRQASISQTLHRMSGVTQAVVAIGSWNPPDSQLLQALPPRARGTLHAEGVRAEICGTLLAEDGAEIPSPEGHLLAIRPDQLRQVPRVLAVAGGATKAEAIRSVLRSGLVTSLVTDSVAAEALASAPDEQTEPSR
jgi:DNA-binding transcriptional regulator LsrR (DeoR family)